MDGTVTKINLLAKFIDNYEAAKYFFIETISVQSTQDEPFEIKKVRYIVDNS